MNHAIRGASSADRWMNCTAQPALEEEVKPKDTSSPAAEEGSAAHALCEVIALQYANTGEHEDPAVYKGRKIGRIFEGDYEILPETTTTRTSISCWSVTQEMVEAVVTYMDEIKHQCDQMLEPVIYVEQSTQPFPGREDMFGTSDLIIVDLATGRIVVMDFKYGKGKIVYAIENPQAMFYAKGALAKILMEFSESDGIEEIRIIIVQPRILFDDGTSISRWDISREDLERWANDELLVKADETNDPEARSFKEGDWCGFCKVSNECPLKNAKALQIAKEGFDDDLMTVPLDQMTSVGMVLPDANDPEQVARALALASMINVWTKRVHAIAQDAALAGMQIPGQKVVRGSKHRAWKDVDKVEQVLKNKAGIKKDDTHTSKLKSPAALEKVKSLGKKWVARYSEKPEGELQLVDESARGKAIEIPKVLAEAFPDDLPVTDAEMEELL